VTLSSQPIPNLIQGVSQQEAQQRRDSQCEAQYDCVNSPKSGCVARNGAELLKFLTGENFADAFFYELYRGTTEHYLMVLKGGVLKVYDLNTGLPCTVSFDAAYTNYLQNTSGRPDKDVFRAQTVDDFTFISNGTVAPAMASTLSTTRPKEALIFFKAGNYSTTYTVSIAYAGSVYKFTYITPDNSASTNASFIATNFLAATFYHAFTNVLATDASAQNTYGVGGVVGGGSGFTQPASLPALGFGVAINGNVLRIWRNDGVDFTVDTTDGGGDNQLVAFKDTVRAFTDLPKNGFAGFTLRVKGISSSGTSDDYFVEYVQNTATGGFWQERTAQGITTDFDKLTMPHAIVNTGVGAFNVRPLTWSKRIAGDGVNTSKVPGFIGKYIQDLFYHQKRLAILTDSTCDWSKARNTFTHFPDTVQTLLDDAPIGLTLSGARRNALFRKAVQLDEALFLWAQGAQLRVHSGQDPFKQNTVESPPSTSYEFAEAANFASVGTSIYWATEPGEYATVRNLPFQQGKPAGEVDVTAHVSEYIPAGVFLLAESDTGQHLFLATDGDPSALYLYNFLIQDRQVIQSAWSKWRLPVGQVLWCAMDGNDLNVVIQRADGVALCRVPMSLSDRDEGYENVLTSYRTRLDLRVKETDCVVAYNATTDKTTVTVPYAFDNTEAANVRVVIRQPNKYIRGKTLGVDSVVGHVVTVAGDVHLEKFYVGLRVSSEREESPFFLRTEKGTVPVESITVRNFKVSHSKTAYYRLEADQGAGRVKVKELQPNKLGTSMDILGGDPPLETGQLEIACDTTNTELTLRIINDSPFPSRWQSAEYQYQAVRRARGAAPQ
jgi:hypothetical protein